MPKISLAEDYRDKIRRFSVQNLESVRNSINETLQALQTNDTAGALQTLNEADRQLFAIMRNLPSNA
jgi:hypothetical protein